MQNPYKQYQKTAITTASKEKILLMLYEGAIRFTRLAMKNMEAGNIAEKGKYISKSTAILSELMATLDFNAGGELALDLESLYIYMIDRLIEGNIHNKMECLQDVDKLLGILHSAWKDVIENPRPDGVPSKKLQPDQFQKFQEGNGQGSEQGSGSDQGSGSRQDSSDQIPTISTHKVSV